MKRIITKMYLCLLAFCIAGGISAQTQNSMTEVIPFKTIDGKIIVEAAINGEVADFVLDLSGHNALLPEALKKLRIDTGKNRTQEIDIYYKGIGALEMSKVTASMEKRENGTAEAIPFSLSSRCFLIGRHLSAPPLLLPSHSPRP